MPSPHPTVSSPDKLSFVQGDERIIVQPKNARRITSGTWGASEEARKVREYREQLAKHIPGIIEKLANLALAGDVGAGKVLLERCIPVPKPVETPITLNFDAEAMQDQAQAIFKAVTSGQIGIEAGSRLLAAMASVQEARLNATIAERLAKLEAKAGAARANGQVVDAPVLRVPARATGGE